jgi:hypothetical protein
MVRTTVATLIALSLTLILLGRSVDPAAACSGGSDWDAVAESDVIVGGEILGWTALARDPPQGTFIAVQLEMRIDHVWKGQAGAPIVDRTSLMVLPTAYDGDTVTTYEFLWAGASGACGALDEDPTGMHAVLGLGVQPDGTLRPNRLTTFYIGDAPYDPTAVRMLSDTIALPTAGQGVVPGDKWLVATHALMMLSATALLCGISLAVRAAVRLR